MAERPLSQVVRERRATPHFEPAPVPDEDLRKILQAGLSAPSGFNLQPWRFVVVRDAEQRKRLRAAAMNQQKVEEAPVMIVACGDSDAWHGEALEEMLRISAEHGYGSNPEKMKQTLSDTFTHHPNIAMWLNRQVMIAFTHMMLMAEALGYDTAPMEGFVESQIKQTLGIPTDDVRVVAMLGIGRLKCEDKKFAGRFPIEHTVFENSWCNSIKA